MKVAIFTYKELKELLDKPSEDATRKWVDSRRLKRRNRENSNVKEILIPYEMYRKIWESTGKLPELSNPPTEEIPDTPDKSIFEDDNIVNAEFSNIRSVDSNEETYRPSYALSTEFTEEFIRELAARQDALMDKNDNLYNKISELSKYEEKAKIFYEELVKKEKAIENYQNRMETLTSQIRELDIVKVKMDHLKDLSQVKEIELNEMKEKIEQLSSYNKQLEEELTKEKNKSTWIRKFIGI